MGSDADIVARGLHRDKPNSTYMETRDELRLHKLIAGQTLARVIGVGGAFLFECIEDMRVQKEVIVGSYDPTEISNAGRHFKLLHLNLTKLGPASIKQPDYLLSVYVIQEHLSNKAVSDLATQLTGIQRSLHDCRQCARRVLVS